MKRCEWQSVCRPEVCHGAGAAMGLSRGLSKAKGKARGSQQQEHGAAGWDSLHTLQESAAAMLM